MNIISLNENISLKESVISWNMNMFSLNEDNSLIEYNFLSWLNTISLK